MDYVILKKRSEKEFNPIVNKYQQMENSTTTTTQNFFRILLGVFMIAAAMGHFTFQRIDFQAQVPNWVPMDKDLVVILSGIVEMVIGLAFIFLTRYKIQLGIGLAIFYVLVFPGNIAQYLNGTDALGMNTDQARLIRLFFQPVLILWALWSTGALGFLLKKR
ncbi:Uncharacterized membrane protein [Flavobacterium saccharophilum]|uniref:Uncharacterized membrane protein n=2 Tax=Flavobacterium saccharophilum TaxID=29534 RepID=A0A1M7LB17_9FLAO|nr:Uncharacterized membrane protein [Flavobacterium saccharophilum]